MPSSWWIGSQTKAREAVELSSNRTAMSRARMVRPVIAPYRNAGHHTHGLSRAKPIAHTTMRYGRIVTLTRVRKKPSTSGGEELLHGCAAMTYVATVAAARVIGTAKIGRAHV